MYRFLTLFTFITLQSLGQSSEITTSYFNNSGSIQNGKYEYSGKLKAQIVNGGMGDITLKLGIAEYQVDGFYYKGTEQRYNHQMRDFGFPIIRNQHQADISGTVIIRGPGGHYDYLAFEFSEPMVSTGALDLHYFSKEEVSQIVQKWDLKNNRNNLENLYVEFTHIKATNTHIEELAEIANEVDTFLSNQNKKEDSNKKDSNTTKNLSSGSKYSSNSEKTEDTKESQKTITREEYLALKKRQEQRETNAKIKNLERQGYNSTAATKAVTADNTNKAIQGASNQIIDGLFGEWDEEAYFAKQQAKIDRYHERKQQQQVQAGYKKEALTARKMETNNSSGLLLKRSNKGWFGYVDENGTWIIKAKYMKAKPFKNGEAEVTTKTNNTIIINTNGKKIRDI